MDCSPYLLFTFQKPRYARSALNRSLVAIDSKASAYGKARGNRYNSLANAIDPRLDSGGHLEKPVQVWHDVGASNST
jgi:hypothetical protein